MPEWDDYRRMTKAYLIDCISARDRQIKHLTAELKNAYKARDRYRELANKHGQEANDLVPVPVRIKARMKELGMKELEGQ